MSAKNLVKVTVNGVVIECTMEQAIKIIKATGGSIVEEKKEAKNAPTTEQKPKYKTRREAIEAKYSEEERKAWGEAKRKERELQKKAYEATNAMFTEKVAHHVWMAQYNATLKALKAAAK